jgi:N-acetylated-alpha-linked acidic dipeptidase
MQFWGLMALRLANDPILPLNNVEYIDYVSTKYTELLKGTTKLALYSKLTPAQVTALDQSFAKLNNDMQNARKVASYFYTTLSSATTDLAKRQKNDKLMRSERAFIDQQGLKGREWYKHLLFAPGLYLGYGGEVFPGIQTAMTRGDPQETLAEIERVRLAFARFIDTMK